MALSQALKEMLLRSWPTPMLDSIVPHPYGGKGPINCKRR